MTTDEEFLKLARKLGTMQPEHEDEKLIVFSGAVIFPTRITFLTLCREIERRALEGAAKRELAGKDLVCFCAPKGCHGDVLLEVANAIELTGAASPRPAEGEARSEVE